jgi:hypothetical protein
MSQNVHIQINLSNKSAKAKRLWIEPWAEELLLPGNTWWKLVFEAFEAAPIPIELQDELIVIYGLVNSTLRIYDGEQIVWESYALFNPPA